jgi:dienelactone hydrolase
MKLNRRELLALAGAAPAMAQYPANAPIEMGPDLANLYEYMDWIGRENIPRLSFLDSKWKSLDAWKREARPVYRTHLSYDPKPLPLSAEVVSREERDGFTLERVRIKATTGYDIPAWVLIPAKRSGRAPGIVAHHCHSGRYVWGHEKVLSAPNEQEVLTAFRNRAYGRPYAEVLARRGYVVVTIDAFYFGERRLRVEEIEPATAPGDMRESLTALRKLKPDTPEWFDAVNSLCGRYEQITAKTIFSAGATWPGILAWDDMRAVDYLCSRPEVDASRIGALGLSIGGLRTARLVAADPRIKVASVTGWMTEFRSQLRNHLRVHTWMAYIPGLEKYLDLPDEVAMTAPGALLVQQCSRDALYPMQGMKGAIEKLTRIYTKAGIPERFKGRFYDVPHSFGPEMQDEAFAWIEKWI